MELPTVPIYAVATTVYSEEFPTPDILALQVLVDQPNANGTITAIYQHSADGINWLTKSTPVSAVNITAGALNSLFGSDDGSTPALPRGRFAISTGTTASCRVRIFVNGRAY